MILLLLIIVICVILSGFFSGSESGFYFINKEALAINQAKGDLKSARVLKILHQPGEMISVTLIGNTLVLQLATYAAVMLFDRLGWASGALSAEVLVTLALFPLFFTFGEVLPKASFRLYPNMLLQTLPILLFFDFIFKPFTIFVRKINQIFDRVAQKSYEEHRFDRGILSASFGHAYAGGVLSEEQVEMLNQTLNTGKSLVEKTMIPLRAGDMLNAHSTVAKMLQLHHKTGHHIFPVYEKTRSHIIGTVDIREVALLEDRHQSPISRCLRPPSFIDKGESFTRAITLFDKGLSVLFIRSDGRVIGYLTRKNSMFRLLG